MLVHTAINMMSIHPDGSLYDDHTAVDSFHKPPRPDTGLYLENLQPPEIQTSTKMNQSYPGIVTTPNTLRLSQALSTPDVTTLLTSVGQPTVTTSQAPTPVRFGHPVTAEQELYAQGFLDALHELHTTGPVPGRQPQATKMPTSTRVHDMPRSVIHHTTQDINIASSPFTGGPNPTLESVAPTYVTATMAHIPSNISASQTESMSAFNSSTAHNFSASSYAMPIMNMYTGNPALDSYNSYAAGHPSQVASGGAMPPQLMKEIQRVVPADMKTQEFMKVERKKARNRIAASKCRLRRLQRESDLQGKVRILKEHNQELNSEVSGLKDQINNLKKALIQHMKGGCHVSLPEGMGTEGLDTTVA